MLNALVRSPPRYHSPTTWPLRITIRPVAPGAASLCFQASASLSQSTPVVSLIRAFAAASGSPVSGSSVRQPPWSSLGGKYVESSAAFRAQLATRNKQPQKNVRRIGSLRRKGTAAIDRLG